MGDGTTPFDRWKNSRSKMPSAPARSLGSDSPDSLRHGFMPWHKFVRVSAYRKHSRQGQQYFEGAAHQKSLKIAAHINLKTWVEKSPHNI